MREHANLHATSITPEQHEKTCGYWYLVTAGAMSHTAFHSRAGLDRWLRERNLKLERELPEQGTYGTSAIIGKYCEHAYLDDQEDFYLLHHRSQIVDSTPIMSNGQYTLGLITEDHDGIRTVHYLNPNVRDRLVFEYWGTRKVMQ